MSGSRRLALVALLVLAAAGCGATTPGAPSATAPAALASAPGGAVAGPVTQRSEGGDVTVEATWAAPEPEARFDVKLDTHSVDLDTLDLTDSVLRNDRGETMSARPWAAPKGGHHREGVLTFDGDATTFFDDAQWIELVIRGVGGLPERILRWELVS
jgi:hypothetical protein